MDITPLTVPSGIIEGHILSAFQTEALKAKFENGALLVIAFVLRMEAS